MVSDPLGKKAYQLEFFNKSGFQRKLCKSCGTAFWTSVDAEFCGDSPCVEFSFLENPLVNKKYNIDQMRELYLGFFEKHGHTRVDKYPVIARWRNDVFLVNASIYDFQPHVTSGMVPPPANPLTISQPCIRMTDLDSVGKTGKHTSSFEMMAHHVFNYPDNEIYWKDRTVELCHELLSKDLGIPEDEISYREHPWIGGGNAGPSLEVQVGGLELATLVFMNLKQDPKGSYEIEGKNYSDLPVNVVDTGYGLERFVWASQATPTIYDCLYPELVNKLIDAMGIEHDLGDERYRKLLAEYSKLAGLLDVSSGVKYEQLIEDIVKQLAYRGVNTTVKEFKDRILPLQSAYAMVDHTRTLALMLSDGIVPSNAKAGYLARLVLRKTMRMMEDYNIKDQLSDLVLTHMDQNSKIMDVSRKPLVSEIVELEMERYEKTIAKGTRLVSDMLRSKALTEKDLIELYDTHGIHPSIVHRIGKDVGKNVLVPDTFDSQLAELHEGEDEEKEDIQDDYDLPATRKLYYEDPDLIECDAKVLECNDGKLILDQTIFYPEGGGQPHDIGTASTSGNDVEITRVEKINDIIIHHIKGSFEPGTTVHLKVNEDRRMAVTRHHSATHIILGAARRVLGPHIWQAGSQLDVDSARVDISHYKRVTQDELDQIEMLANQTALQHIQVDHGFVPKEKAESEHGFGLYQGGVPFAKEIRVVKMGDFDVEACGGTHVDCTSDIGYIKILKSERIQDGVERLEFAAGLAAVKHMQESMDLLRDSAEVLRVPPEQLPKTAERFFNEWKERGKTIEELQSKMLDSLSEKVQTLDLGIGTPVQLLVADMTAKQVSKFAKDFLDKPGIIIIGGREGNQANLLIASKDATKLNCGLMLQEAIKEMDGKGGGGPTFAQGKGKSSGLDKAIEKAKDLISRT